MEQLFLAANLGDGSFFVQGSSDDTSCIVHSLTTYIHPLAVGDFVRTRSDLLTERPKVANKVEVAASEADVVHVSETNQRHKLRTDAGLFENFSYGGNWKVLPWKEKKGLYFLKQKKH